MELRKNIIEVINFLISNHCRFAIFTLPNSDDIELFVEVYKSSAYAFVIKSFQSEEEQKYIVADLALKNEEIKLSNLNVKFLKKHSQHKPIKQQKNFNVFTKKEYENYVADIVLECRSDNLKKGVCARIKKVNKPNDFNVGEYFLKLVKNYHNAFVNLYYHESCGVWIGATPELLIEKIDKNNFKTVSLAGTKLISKNRDWSDKEIEEQQIVTDYIKELLISRKTELTNDVSPKTINAGQIQHLKSEIEFTSNIRLDDLAKLLHPTPAVCGMPVNIAKDFIEEYEEEQRENYSGYIGLTGLKRQVYFVNLRCMQILENDFLVYVGAGITKDSIPENEWQETENKAQTLLRLI